MVSEVELATRLVFIDTCAYESKNFNFGIDSLGRIQEFIEYDKIHLLLPEIIKSEIEKHIRIKSESIVNILKKTSKERDLKMLTVATDLPCVTVLTPPTPEEIYKNIHDKFLEFINFKNVEIVSVDDVNPKIIFDNYFESRPPFSNPKKKCEFPDAFVLEAINQISKNRKHAIYVISPDNDMKLYAENHDNMIHLNTVNELISLIIHNDSELAEPADFADQIFEYLKEKIIIKAEEILYESEFDATQFSDYLYDDIISNINIDLFEISEKNLQEVSTSESLFQVSFNVILTVDFSIPDYDSSPWDSEDKRYLFINTERFSKQYKEKYSSHITLSYEDGIKKNAEITEFTFDDQVFELKQSLN